MIQPITTVHYLVLSAALLLIGTIGVLTRRNIVIILMSIELILNAVNINLIAFSQHLQNMGGQIFTIFVIMLVNLDEQAKERQFNGQRWIALACVAVVGAQVFYFLRKGSAAFQLAEAGEAVA